MSAIQLLQIFARYVFNSPITWIEEIVGFSIIWLTFLGGANVYRSKGLTTVNIILNKLKGRIKITINILLSCIEIIIFSILIYYGFSLSKSVWNVISPALGVKLGLVYIVAPVASMIMLLYVIEFIVSSVSSFYDYNI